MIDESNLLKFCCSGIYDNTKALTQTEIIMQIIEKLNLIILNFNDLENKTLKNMKNLDKQVNYYLDTGMKIEVSKKIDQMVEDGSFNTIVNNELLYDLSNQVETNKDDIAAIKEKINMNGGV